MATSTSTTQSKTPAASATPAPRSRRRSDIEGLRGLAIALVVVFHVFIGRVSSGVDVFLLLGGIFFFGTQLSNAQRKNGMTFVQALVRMIRRLFPMLAVVVFATLATGLVVMNELIHISLAKDAVASLGYFINWQLALSGREYAAVQTTISPFQHLWSMSAQFQIYVGSLLIVTLIALIFRRFARSALVVFLMLATAASFAYATHLNLTDQELNYYSTFSRFWEIGLGGLIGLMLFKKPATSPNIAQAPSVPFANLPVWLRWILGLVGLGMIVSVGLFLNGAKQFPGPWTLLPLGGALLIIIAGQGGTSVGLTRLLETPVFQFLGKISYSLYLWHWPLLVIVLKVSKSQSVEPLIGIGVIAASIALAWLTTTLIDKPLQQKAKPARRSWIVNDPRYWWNAAKAWPKTIAAVVIVGLSAAVVASPFVLQSRLDSTSQDLWALARERDLYPGSLAFSVNARVPEGIPLIPPLDDFDKLLPPTQADGCQIGFEPDHLILTRNYNRSDEECAYGDTSSKRTLYAIGGSHTEHFIPALDIIGKRQGVKVIPLLKMGCPVNSDVTKIDGSEYTSCRTWSKKVVSYINENPPTEGVFMTSTRPTTILGRGPERVPSNYVDLVRQFTSWGIHSYLIRDTPWMVYPDYVEGTNPQLDARTCVADMISGDYAGPSPKSSADVNVRARAFPGLADKSKPTPEEITAINEICGTRLSDSLERENPAPAAYEGLNVTHLDITGSVCRDGWCPAIIGNMVAYRDSHHYSNIFAATFADELEAQMYDPNYQPRPVSFGRPAHVTPSATTSSSSSSTSSTSTTSTTTSTTTPTATATATATPTATQSSNEPNYGQIYPTSKPRSTRTRQAD